MTSQYEKLKEVWMTRPNANLEALISRELIRINVSSELLRKSLNHVSENLQGFQELRNLIKRPEVAQDYRDLNYAAMLEFCGEVEHSIADTQEVLTKAKALSGEIGKEFTALKTDSKISQQSKDASLKKLLERIRQSQEIRSLNKQLGIQSILDTLKEKRKKFGDCSVRLNLSIRKEEIDLLKESIDELAEKFDECSKSANYRLISTKSTAEETSKFLRLKTNELCEYEKQLDECKQVIREQQELHDKLKGDVKDYDELLPESKLDIICPFIERISQI